MSHGKSEPTNITLGFDENYRYKLFHSSTKNNTHILNAYATSASMPFYGKRSLDNLTSLQKQFQHLIVSDGARYYILSSHHEVRLRQKLKSHLWAFSTRQWSLAPRRLSTLPVLPDTPTVQLQGGLLPAVIPGLEWPLHLHCSHTSHASETCGRSPISTPAPGQDTAGAFQHHPMAALTSS